MSGVGGSRASNKLTTRFRVGGMLRSRARQERNVMGLKNSPSSNHNVVRPTFDPQRTQPSPSVNVGRDTQRLGSNHFTCARRARLPATLERITHAFDSDVAWRFTDQAVIQHGLDQQPGRGPLRWQRAIAVQKRHRVATPWRRWLLRANAAVHRRCNPHPVRAHPRRW